MKRSFSSTDTMEMLNAILTIDQTLEGLDYLETIAKNISKIFNFEYVFIGKAIPPDQTSVRTLVALKDGQLIDNINYDLVGTPCENVFSGNRVCIHSDNVAASFPDDEMLVKMGVQSDIGAPTIIDGRLFGLIAMLDKSPIEDTQYYATLIEFIASRISIELERVVKEDEINQLKIEAHTDDLTGLINRNYFYILGEQNKQKHDESAIFFIDVDNFKKINDTYGHQCGDDVLCEVAKQLKNCVRDQDVVARFGGEEFVIFLPGTDKATALQITERVHQYVATKTEEIGNKVTVSIGLALSKKDEPLINAIQRADNAVYVAKNNGKNQTVVAED